MAISNFPLALQPIIQTGYLERSFERGLVANLAFRGCATREPVSMRIGESITKTRPGLLPVDETPLNPQAMGAFPANSFTNLDNGLVPVNWGVEQYTLSINEHGLTMNLNTVGETVGIVNQFVQNAYALGENARRKLDRLARNALYAPYLAGNTRVRTAATTANVPVDDVRGLVAGGTISIGQGVYTIASVAIDSTNVSTIPKGVSGVLTLTAAVSASDGAAGNAVVGSTAAKIVRPNNRTSTSGLVAGDELTMAALLDAKASLENNAVPRINGFYHMYMDPTSSRELFADPDFKQLYQGATSEVAAYRNGQLDAPFLGIRFFQTTEAPISSLSNVTIHRPIIVGEGALIEGDFAGQNHHDTSTSAGEFAMVDGVTMVTREPLDRLQQEIAQSYYWIGGFCAPTDTTANPSIIGTASNAAYKRAVVIEHI